MKLNMKVRYGLRAMADIAENQKNDEGVFQKDISSRQELPLKYLDTIISGLRNAGLIRNASGKRSGYILMKKPSAISVYDIYRSFEPELTLVNCLCENMECRRSDICPAKDYWFELNKHLKMMMQDTSLKQIMQKGFAFRKILI